MTYVLAWKTDKEVFICADSAVTAESITGGPLPRNDGYKRILSSFDEPHMITKYKVVQERILKIRRINQHTMIGFAGTNTRALNLVNELVKIYEAKSEQAITAILEEALGPESTRPSDVELVVGTIEHGMPRILSYIYSRDPQIRTDEVIVHLGSFRNHKKHLVEEINTYLLSRRWTDGSVTKLSLLIAYLQTFTFIKPHEFMGIGVGGHFSGTVITAEGSQWPEDTVVMLYSAPPLVEKKRFSIMYRHDSVLVLSKDEALLLAINDDALNELYSLSLSIPIDVLPATSFMFFNDQHPLALVWPNFVGTMNAKIQLPVTEFVATSDARQVKIISVTVS